MSIPPSIDGSYLLYYLLSVVWDLIGLDTPALYDFSILFHVSVPSAESSFEGITTIVKSIKDAFRVYLFYCIKVRLLKACSIFHARLLR